VYGIYILYQETKEQLLILVLPILFLLVISGLGKYPMQDRLLLFIYPFFFLLISHALIQIYEDSKNQALIFLFLSFLYPLLSQTVQFIKQPLMFDHIRPIIEEILQDIREEDTLLIWGDTGPAFNYYERQLGFKLENSRQLHIDPWTPVSDKTLDDTFINLTSDKVYFLHSHAFGQAKTNIHRIREYLSDQADAFTEKEEHKPHMIEFKFNRQ
jgi:hypothetical protein